MALKSNRKIQAKAPKKAQELLPPLLYPARGKSEEAWMTELKKKKLIRKIGPRLYTSLPKADVPALVRSQWTQIISHLYPDALLSHRSALEFKVSAENTIVLTSTTNRQVKYPGLTLHFVRGPAALADDGVFLDFHTSSLARALLENFSSGKTTAWRSLPIEEIENRLESILQANGENRLNEVRERASAIAAELSWEKEFKKLDQLIGALLGTRASNKLQSPRAQARVRQMPFDIERVTRFNILFAALRSTPVKELKDSFTGRDHFKNKAFFEAYFSNYIEGTTFEIKEAEEIIFDHVIPADRPKDAHDILGTFQIVADPNEMKRTPLSLEELEDLLQTRHYTLMQNRPEVSAGKYKTKPNRAGDTHFVLPENIKGTLAQGFQRYQNLPEGFARAAFMMFLIAEVHPFIDGNGRIARIMMNAELERWGLSSIIIPNVFREDYLTSLRALTRRDRPDPLLRMLLRAHKFSNLDFSDYKKSLKDIEGKNWFREPSEAKLIES